MASISELQIRESIREILRNADLSALSSKTVRKKLEEKFQTDLTARKQEIDDILMALIDEIGEEKDGQKETGSGHGSDSNEDNDDDQDDDEEESNGKPSASAGSSASKNGSASLANTSSSQSKRKRSRSSSGSGTDSDSDADIVDNSFQKTKSSSKKRRGSDAQTKGTDGSSSEDGVDDEALARQLQQQELRMRPRSSKQKVEKKPKSSKSASSEGSGSKKKGNSLYSQECVLSHELAAVMGTDRLARKDVVSRMWKIFKERNLMDPKNKQYVICDEQLEKVFKVKKFKAFSMMKILKTHIKDAKLIQQP